MKLRSGKVLHYEKLPKILEDKLNNTLNEVKTLLIENKKFAQELIELISFAPNINERVKISRMIEEAFYNVLPEEKLLINDLLAASGALLMLITRSQNFYKDNNIPLQPNFHDVIQEKMLKAFDIDTSLTGVINQIDNTEI